MHPRRLLASATLPTVIGLAGCIGDADDSNSIDGGTDVVLELRDLQPHDQPQHASVTIDVLNDLLSEDTFPTLEITAGNSGDEPIDMRWREPRSPPWMDDIIIPDQLAIYPTEFITENLIDEPGCARIEQVGSYGDRQRDTLDPGETMTAEYGIVFVEGKLRDWPDPGEYRVGGGFELVGEPWGFDFKLVQVEGDSLPREPTAEGGIVLDGVHLDEQPDPLRMTVDITEDRLSEDSVPVVGIAMENTGEAVHEIIGSSSLRPPWPALTTDDRIFHFVPNSNVHQSVLNEPGCPRMEFQGKTRDVKLYTIEPEEVVTEEYALVGIDGEYEGDCPNTGVYRAEAHLRTGDKWGFGLEFDEA